MSSLKLNYFFQFWQILCENMKMSHRWLILGYSKTPNSKVSTIRASMMKPRTSIRSITQTISTEFCFTVWAPAFFRAVFRMSHPKPPQNISCIVNSRMVLKQVERWRISYFIVDSDNFWEILTEIMSRFTVFFEGQKKWLIDESFGRTSDLRNFKFWLEELEG